MRGAAPPAGVRWTQIDSLPPLSPKAAEEAFLAINPLSIDGNIDSDNQCNLDILLKEMDYVPLAIRLLAQVSMGFSSQYMLKRWRTEKTALLRTREVQLDRLESIEVSISLSLATLDITNNPEAIQLLGVLCQLPDGLLQWEERLPLIGAGFQNVHHLMHLLHKTALLFIAGDMLKVLSPIRHFIIHHHPPDPHHIQCLENYFWGLIHSYMAKGLAPGTLQAKEILEADIGNISHLAVNCVKNHPSSQIVDTILEISQFLYLTHPSTELLYEVIPFVKQMGIPKKEAQISQTLGDILLMQNRYTEASDALREAQRQFLEIGDVLGAAQCLRSLGNILRMQDKYTEASDTLREAQRQFLEIGYVLGAAQCLQRLGDILRMQNKYTEASDTLREAQRQFLEIGDVLGAAQCLQSLGNILHMPHPSVIAFLMHSDPPERKSEWI